MNKLIAACLTACIVAGPSLARAETIRHTGTIQVGHPVTYIFGGVTENLAACNPNHARNGFDGRWYAIPPEKINAEVTLRATDANADLQDLDAWFYTKDCDYIDDESLGSEGMGATERGFVPDDAAFVIVTLFTGYQAAFELLLLEPLV